MDNGTVTISIERFKELEVKEQQYDSKIELNKLKAEIEENKKILEDNKVEVVYRDYSISSLVPTYTTRDEIVNSMVEHELFKIRDELLIIMSRYIKGVKKIKFLKDNAFLFNIVKSSIALAWENNNANQ